MAVLAIAANGRPVLRSVATVVAPEAAVRRQVADVVRVRSPGHFHRGEHVVPVRVLEGLYSARERALIDRPAPTPVELAETPIDGRQCHVVTRVRLLQDANTFTPHEWQPPIDVARGDRTIDRLLGRGQDPMADGVVAIDTVQNPAHALRELL